MRSPLPRLREIAESFKDDVASIFDDNAQTNYENLYIYIAVASGVVTAFNFLTLQLAAGTASLWFTIYAIEKANNERLKKENTMLWQRTKNLEGQLEQAERQLYVRNESSELWATPSTPDEPEADDNTTSDNV